MQSTKSFLFSEKTQFPLGGTVGLAVDKAGRVYLGLQSYGRIQAYTSTGEFTKGWFVNTVGGPFYIWIEDDHFLHVYTTVRPRHDVFDSNGQLVESIKTKPYDEDKHLFEKAGGLKKQDAFGNTYVIQNRWWCPKVVKISPSGLETPLITNPYYVWLMQPPLVPWLTFSMGVIMTAILVMIIRKKVDFPKVHTVASCPLFGI